jgi:D-alanine transaminase
LNGDILPEDKIKISPFDRGFLFADGVYETIRWDFGKIFRLQPHINRLKRNLNELKISLRHMPDIESITKDLINASNISSEHILIYIQVTRGAYFPRQHYFPPADVNPTVFISANPFNRNLEAFEKGIKVILTEDIRWTRCDIKSVSLLPNILARQKARENKASEAVFVRNGLLTEGSHTNFCGVRNGNLHTAPLSEFILPGITRKIIFEICKILGTPVIEEYIKQTDLKNFDELMVIGTISEVTPVIQVDDWIVGNGKPGTVTMELQKRLINMIFGTGEKFSEKNPVS